MPKKSKSSQGLVGPSLTEQKKWEAEEALRTMRRAEEIKANKSLLGRVKALAKKEMQVMNKFANGK
jgi:hypothetical protein